MSARGTWPERGSRSFFATSAATLSITIVGSLPAFLIAALAVEIRQTIPFPSSAIGICFGVFFGASAIGSVIAGPLFTRISTERTISTAALLTSLSLVGLSFIPAWYYAIPWLAIGGLANGVAQLAANLLITESLAAGRHGFAFGVKQAGVPATILIAGFAVPGLALTVGWEWVLRAAAVAAFAYLYFTPRPVPQPRRRQRNASVRQRVPLAALACLSIAVFFGAAAADSLAAFFIDSAVATGITPARAGLLLAAGGAACVTARLVAGYLADSRIVNPLMAVSVFLGVAAVSYTILITDTKVSAYATPLYFAAGWGWPGLLYFAVARDNPGREAFATGIVQGGTFAGAVIGPVIFGILVTHVSYRSAWATATAWMAVAAIGVYATLRMFRATSTNVASQATVPRGPSRTLYSDEASPHQ